MGITTDKRRVVRFESGEVLKYKATKMDAFDHDPATDESDATPSHIEEFRESVKWAVEIGSRIQHAKYGLGTHVATLKDGRHLIKFDSGVVSSGGGSNVLLHALALPPP